MESVEISVIIPLYNGAKHLEKAIQSIVNQDYVSEIIVIDDKSTDNSLEILISIQAKYPKLIQIVQHDFLTNVGAGKSRNLGIAAAKNKWLAFLDVDDYYYPNRFNNAVKIISESSNIDGVYEAVENVFENDAAEVRFRKTRPERYKSGKLKDRLNLFTLDSIIDPKDLFKYLIRGTIGFFHFNGILVKKELLEDVGLLNEELELTQDTDLFLKIASKGSLYPGNINEAVAARLVHDDNRIYKDDEKLKYFRALNFFSLKKWAEEHGLGNEILNEIDTVNIKHCAESILHMDIYKYYRLKFLFLKIFHRSIIKRYLKRESKKYIV